MRRCMTAWLMALGLLVGPQAAWAQTSGMLVPDDHPLHAMKADYDKHYMANERAFQAERDHAFKEIRELPNLDKETRQTLMQEAHRDYVAKSRENVAKYREPMINAMKDVANDRTYTMRKDTALDDTLGTQLYDDRGSLNQSHRGHVGDKDMGGGNVETKRFGKVAQELGFDVDDANADTLDVNALEVTINRGVGDYDKPGSSSHEAKIRTMAENKETYVSVTMEADQPGKTAVQMQDHKLKAAEGRKLAEADPSSLLRADHQPKLQGYAKGTKKMMEDLDKAGAGFQDSEVNARLRQNGFDGDADDFRHKLTLLKEGVPPEAVGIDATQMQAMAKTSNDLQDAAVDRANALARDQVRTETAAIDQQRKRLLAVEDKLGMTGVVTDAERAALAAERETLHRDITRRQERLMDSQVRLQATEDAANAKLGRETNARGNLGNERRYASTADLESSRSLRDKLNSRGGKVLGSGFKAMDYADKATKAYAFATGAGAAFARGNYQEGFKQTAAFMKDQAGEYMEGMVDELKDKAIERVIPGYGQVKSAWDLGWTTGELIGKVPISADGKTINGFAQDQFQDLLDANSGVAAQERRNMIRDRFIASVKNGATLPEGMRLSEAWTQINQNLDAGRAPLSGLDIKPAPRPVPKPTANIADGEDGGWGQPMAPLADHMPEPPAPASAALDWANPNAVLDQLGGPAAGDAAWQVRQQVQQQGQRDLMMQKQDVMQAHAASEQERIAEIERQQREAAELAAGMQSLVGGLQAVQQGIAAYDARHNAMIEQNNAQTKANVDAMIQRYNSQPSATDLIMGTATLPGMSGTGSQAGYPSTDPYAAQYGGGGGARPLSTLGSGPSGNSNAVVPRGGNGATFGDLTAATCNQVTDPAVRANCMKQAKSTYGGALNEKVNSGSGLDAMIKASCAQEPTPELRQQCTEAGTSSWRALAGGRSPTKGIEHQCRGESRGDQAKYNACVSRGKAAFGAQGYR